MQSHTSWSDEESSLLRSERETEQRLAHEGFDLETMHALANIHRAANALRERAEREILTDRGLSARAITIMWALWIWGQADPGALAARCHMAKATLTGVLGTLEREQLISRKRVRTDRRRHVVALTDAGQVAIRDAANVLNQFDIKMSAGLTSEQKQQLAALLRVIIKAARPDEG